MQCPSCRSFNELEAAFCNQCGARLDAPISPAVRKARIVVRVLSMVLVLLAIGGVLWIARLPDPPVPRAQPSGMSPTGSRRAPAAADGGQEGEALSVQAVGGQDAEPRPLDLERAVESLRPALVTLELRGEEGRPLREERGVIVDSTGVVLTRFRPLLGALQGSCRLSSPRESRVEIAGLVYRDESLDLALVRIGRSPVGYPMVALLTEPPASALHAGDRLFLFSGIEAVETSLDQAYHVSEDGVGRALVAERPPLPPDPFLVLDAYGLLVGLCRLELEGRALAPGAAPGASMFRVLVDPAASLASAVPQEAALTLYALTRSRYEGTFADYFTRGSVAAKQGRWREAVDNFELALDRVVMDRPEEDEVAKAVAGLRESYMEEIQRLSGTNRIEEAALLAETAAGRYPAESIFLVRLGELRFAQQNWLAGVQALTSARQLDSTAHVESLLEQGYLQLAAESAQYGDARSQESNLLAGVRALPASAPLQLELARLYFDLGAYPSAIPLLERVRELSTDLRGAAENLLVKIDDILKRRDAVVIPIQPGSKAIRSEVTVDGARTLDFIIDTGATYTTISDRLAKELGYQPDFSPKGRLIPVNTAGGRIIGTMINIHSLAVGSYSVPNLEVLVLPDTLGPDAGLLGLNFLKNFRYTVDATRNEFRLERP